MDNLFLIEPNYFNFLMQVQGNIDISALKNNRIDEAQITTPPYENIDGNLNISVNGILSNNPNSFMVYIGAHTAYQGIMNLLQQAENDDSVREVTLKIDSIGGSVSGLSSAMKSITDFNKPIKSYVVNGAASAAYALASATDKIILSDKMSTVGSIGVVAMVPKSGENFTIIRSSKSPFKMPDGSDTKALEGLRQEMDDKYDIFVAAIANGRKTTVENVNENFGQGAMLIAEKAIAAGMADEIQSSSSIPISKSNIFAINNTGTVGNVSEDNITSAGQVQQKNKEVAFMDLTQLKAEHPNVYSEVFALGESAGVTNERMRVNSHLNFMETGDKDRILADIKAGNEFTTEAMSAHGAYAQKQQMITATAQDTASIPNTDIQANIEEGQQGKHGLKDLDASFANMFPNLVKGRQ
jgi:ClpP class serine protease